MFSKWLLWFLGRIQVSNGNRLANGARLTKIGVSRTPSFWRGGILSGPARPRQPRWWGRVLRWGYKKFWGGFPCSSPPKKGKKPPLIGTGSTFGPKGRLARSVAMMTQRPTIGSLRNSGISHRSYASRSPVISTLNIAVHTPQQYGPRTSLAACPDA